jgi:hypothetical protein
MRRRLTPHWSLLFSLPLCLWHLTVYVCLIVLVENVDRLIADAPRAHEPTNIVFVTFREDPRVLDRIVCVATEYQRVGVQWQVLPPNL